MPLSQSHHKAASIDQLRRRYILLFASYISSLTLLLMGFYHLFSADLSLQLLIFGAALALLLISIWFHRSQQLQLACTLVALFALFFVLLLVWHGGSQNTALYWVFPVPLIMFGLLGAKAGIILNLLMFSGLIFLLFGPELQQARYTTAEVPRFLASFATVLAVGWINEHFRERSHHSMSVLQHSKEQQANTDVLTNLANRRFLEEVLPEHTQQQPELFFPMAVVMTDIDHFKHINDSFGHDQGDLVLQQAALLFRQKLRTQDICCRYGGEEFLLLLPKTSLQDALRVADKIRAAIAQKRLLPQHPDLVITGSFGVAEATAAEDIQAAIKRADQQLYLSKASGRNQVH
ncbi:GGDEF domain-containing protein [Rheinheimera sp.]|uniref:GGDEF domain-containing protein n=1 Tax=Rheinheimera sp. TaxID=1869214 RepID=UPI002FDE73DD